MKQEEALNILKMGHSAFLTGPAGSGKTFLLNQYITYLKKKDVHVAITASTGIASTHLDGRTIHSWCGIGINESMTRKQIESLLNKENIWSRVHNTKVLIIDEISMLNASRLDLVDNICKAVHQDLRPFGGMQVVLCGDFFQLPPVANDKEDNRFVIDSEIWNTMDIQICYIDEQYRQDDPNFIKVLNDIRNNRVTQKTFQMLNERLNKDIDMDIEPTKLRTHNKDADAHNIFELNKLSGEEYVYDMHSEGVPKLVKDLKRSCLAYETLRLKIGAVVMFIKNNFGRKYVNGTLGKVIGFDPENSYPIVETVSGYEIIAYPERWSIDDSGEILASITQVPLRLAWAITIHKSQGMSLDCAEIDLGKSFEYGMGYVALSRVRSLGGIKLIGINELALHVNPKVIDLDKNLYSKSSVDLKEHLKLTKKGIKKIQKEFVKNNKKEETKDFFGIDLPF